MTQREFEHCLIERLKDIKALYKRYNPRAFEQGNKLYLSMFITESGISANNGYFREDENNPDKYRPVRIYNRGD